VSTQIILVRGIRVLRALKGAVRGYCRIRRLFGSAIITGTYANIKGARLMDCNGLYEIVRGRCTPGAPRGAKYLLIVSNV